MTESIKVGGYFQWQLHQSVTSLNDSALCQGGNKFTEKNSHQLREALNGVFCHTFGMHESITEKQSQNSIQEHITHLPGSVDTH